MKLFNPAIWISLILLYACNDQYDAQRAAKIYCDCMKKNGAPNQYAYATTVCKAALIQKNRYFRLAFIEMHDGELSDKLSQATKDSTNNFTGRFFEATRSSCCYEILFCKTDTLNK